MPCRFGSSLVTGVLVFTLGASWVPAGRGQSDEAEKIYNKTLRATVWIVAPLKGERNRAATGTGSLIDAQRKLVITNFHVIGDADTVSVLFPHFNSKGELETDRTYYVNRINSGAGIRAKVLYRDKQRDLALLELASVPVGAHALRLADKSAKPAQHIHSIGNPGRGNLWGYTPGMVRQVGPKTWEVEESGRRFEFKARVVEATSPTNKGDSGGPTVNDHGDLVAVTQGYALNAQQLSLFIDVSEVKEFLRNHKISPRLSTAANGREPRPGIEKPGDKAVSDEDKTERQAAIELKFANTLAHDGKLEKAKDRYEAIIADYPKTEAAKQAKQLLEKYKGDQ